MVTTLEGGSGNDIAVFARPVGATADLNSCQVTGYGTHTLTGIESLIDGSGADKFIGDGTC